MFATVNIEYRRQDDVIAVPTEAVLHSGRREFVFVAKVGGRFEARDVVTGLRGDHRMVEVRSGLDIGEEVVVNGQFLIDSESQLQEAIRKIVSGGEEQDAASPDSSAVSGQGWSCPMHPEERGGEKDRCGLCGMFLERDEAAEVAPEASGQGWSCPMHPEERGGEKDRCGLCGMFLERDEAAEDAP
jgi:ferredoxin-thioredoxin reductase catalytic subunit